MGQPTKYTGYSGYGTNDAFYGIDNSMYTDVDFSGRPITMKSKFDVSNTQGTGSMYDLGGQDGGQSFYDNAGDFLGSKGFGNSMSAIGLGLNSYFNYKQMQNQDKFNNKMFDMQEGQINRANKFQDDKQAAYNGSLTKKP